MRNRKGIKYTENKWQTGRSTSVSVITCKWIKTLPTNWQTGFLKNITQPYILYKKLIIHCLQKTHFTSKTTNRLKRTDGKKYSMKQ